MKVNYRGILPLTFADLIRFRGRRSFGSIWCSFIPLRTLSIHLSLGLPRGLFPRCYFLSIFLILRFWVTYVVIGLTIASLGPELFISDSVFQCFALNQAFWSRLCASKNVAVLLCVAPNSLPYIKVGLMTVLYRLFFSLIVGFYCLVLSCIT